MTYLTREVGHKGAKVRLLTTGLYIRRRVAMKHRFILTVVGGATLMGALFVAPSAAASAPATATSAPATARASVQAAHQPTATPNTAPGCSASGTPGNWSMTYYANRYCTYTAIRSWVVCETFMTTHYGPWAYANGSSKASCAAWEGGLNNYGYDYSN